MVVAYIDPGRRELPGIHFDLAIPILWGLQTVWKNPPGLTLSHRGQLVSQMAPYQDSVTSSSSGEPAEGGRFKKKRHDAHSDCFEALTLADAGNARVESPKVRWRRAARAGLSGAPKHRSQQQQHPWRHFSTFYQSSEMATNEPSPSSFHESMSTDHAGATGNEGAGGQSRTPAIPPQKLSVSARVMEDAKILLC